MKKGKTINTKILSIISCLVLIVSSVVINVAVSNNQAGGNRNSKSEALSLEELKNKKLTVEEVPVGIDYDEAVEAGHKVRLYSEEPNIYTVIFQNEDNTRTMYYYNVPAKYEDKYGNVKDSDNSIVKCREWGYAYKNACGAFSTKFPKDIKKGIKLKGNNEINVKPIGISTKNNQNKVSTSKGALAVGINLNVLDGFIPESSEIKATEECVDYFDVFGENTVLRYTPLLNGVKQDVILNEPTDKSTYSFEFDFEEGEIVDLGDGGLYVSNPETEEMTGYINPIYVFDAAGKVAENCYYTYEKTADNTWIVTANVNQEFLLSEDTVYPVTVDPDYTDIGDYGVKDISLYKSNPDENNPSTAVLYAGKRSEQGVSRILIAFTSLDLTAIDESQIYTSYFSLRDLMCYETEITLQAYEYYKSWSESTVTWNSAGLSDSSNYASSPAATKTISYELGLEQTHTHRYYFNIKSVAKKWCTGTHYPSYGFMVKSSSESTTKCGHFGSSEASSNKPTLVLRYLAPEQTVANGTYYLKNGQSGKYMTAQNSDEYDVYQKSLQYDKYQQWKVKYVSDGYYTLSPVCNTGRNLKLEHQYDGDTESNIRTATATGSEYQLFRIIKSKYGYRLVPKKYLEQAVQIASGSTSDSTVKLTEYNKKNYQNWAFTTVKPDLKVSALSTSGNVVGSAVNISTTIQNLYYSAGASTANVKITNSAGTSVLSKNLSVSSLAASGTKALSTSFTPSAAGKYTITVTADSASAISEQSESNNTKTATVTVLDKPDLTVSALSCGDTITGTATTISATVKNVNSTAAASKLAINVKNSSGTSVYSTTLSVSSLAASGTKSLTASWTPSTAGTYTITATADSAGAVSEKNESNNTKTVTVTVLDKPDLTVSALSCGDTIIGEAATISATVKNVNSTAAASKLAINVKNSSGTSVYSTTISVSSLAASGTKSSTASWTPNEVGTYTITATVDSAGTVSEKNESNNVKTITIDVTDKDDLSDSTIAGATNVVFDGTAIEDNPYGSKKSVSITDHYIYKSNDIDYYKVSVENLIMLQIIVPDNLTVSVVEVTDDGQRVLGTSSAAGNYLKVKTTNNPCYIEVKSSVVGEYTLNIETFVEK